MGYPITGSQNPAPAQPNQPKPNLKSCTKFEVLKWDLQFCLGLDEIVQPQGIPLRFTLRPNDLQSSVCPLHIQSKDMFYLKLHGQGHVHMYPIA